MGRQYYNRYNNFILNGEQTVVPYITLPSKSTDKRYVYKVAQTRLDKLSQQYYGAPYFGWLILVANPLYGGQEWSIPDGSILTIPWGISRLWGCNKNYRLKKQLSLRRHKNYLFGAQWCLNIFEPIRDIREWLPKYS